MCKNKQKKKKKTIWSLVDRQEALNTMKRKSPGNDALLTKIFCEAFWSEVKTPLLKSFRKSFLSKKLSTSQKQVAIKLIEKNIEINLLQKFGNLLFIKYRR